MLAVIKTTGNSVKIEHTVVPLHRGQMWICGGIRRVIRLDEGRESVTHLP